MDDRTITELRRYSGVVLSAHDSKYDDSEGALAAIVGAALVRGATKIAVFTSTTIILNLLKVPVGARFDGFGEYAKHFVFEDERSSRVTVYTDWVAEQLTDGALEADCVVVDCHGAGFEKKKDMPTKHVVDHAIRPWLEAGGKDLTLLVTRVRMEGLTPPKLPPVVKSETIMANERLWGASIIARKMLQNEQEDELNSLEIERLLLDDIRKS